MAKLAVKEKASNFYAREFARLIKELAAANAVVAAKEKEIDELLEEYHAS